MTLDNEESNHAEERDSGGILRKLLGQILEGGIEVLDLSQPLDEDTPVLQLPPPFNNTQGFKYQKLSEYDERGESWYWNDFVAGEHVGTHFDAPVHWVSGREGDRVDTMPTKNMIGEACVIDVTEASKADPDYLLTVEDIREFEEEHGRISEHAWVILRTGWGEYAQDSERFHNVGDDGLPHTPGFAEEASVFLARERDILGVGVETVGTDAGIAPTFDTPFPTHYYMHEANRYGLTQLANVHQLPARGSIIIAAPLKITEGSGSPIRPLALVPKG